MTTAQRPTASRTPLRMTAKADTRTAAQAYRQHRQDADNSLRTLAAMLAGMDATRARETASNPDSWAWVGDIAHIAAKLRELEAHIAGEDV